MRRSILITLIILSAMFPQRTLSAQDSIRVSLITCSPGALVYEVYGHTAIRIQDCLDGTDIVYNYGMFNFNSPHFVWRWLKGETDYLLGRESWTQFINGYMSRGSTVYVQELGISKEEKIRLSAMLAVNSRPENRTYRYNFLRNNCATMALDKIEEATEGVIEYHVQDTAHTYRDILHEFNIIEPWNNFGIDLIVGAEADTPISERETAFAPLRLMRLLSDATVTDTAGNVTPLIAETYGIQPQEPLQFKGCNINPTQAMLLILLLTLLICCVEWNVKRIFWITDVIIFSAQGIAGILITFLVLFSSHPTADSNWLVICLNPLPLICLPFMLRNITHRRKDIFLIYNLAVTTAFILFSNRIPQYIAPATLVMLGIFALRSLNDIHFLYNVSLHQLFFRIMKKGKRTVSIMILLLSISVVAHAQGTRPTPKLVVGIVIDQLDREYVRRLMPLFEDEGFRRFWYHGYNIPNASFDYNGEDRASAIASIYTGSTPFYHGIVGENWIERKSLSKVGAVDDSDENGINTLDRCSPRRLQVLTITDQLELQSRGSSITCSIAPERDAAILAGGHDPDVVLWMNDADGRWCSSSYYGAFPSWVKDADNETPWDSEWKPSLPTVYYINDSNDPRTRYFSYRFGKEEISNLKTSPMVNSRITAMAIKSIDEMQLGVSGATDFLAITLYAGGLGHQPVGLESMELQDTYARIDRNLADLINHIDQKIGIDNVLFFLTSTGYRDTESRVQSYNPRMPAGSVNMERVTALLNLYLSAIYNDTKEYISTYNGTQLYLNRDMLEKSDISIQSIYDHCVDLLLQMSGIRGVFTQRDLMSANLGNDARRKRDALNLSCSGDLILEIIPGWTVIDEIHGTSHLATRSVTEFPIMFYGSGVRAYMDERPTSASSLAATVSWISGIQAPDACSSTPITGIR